MSDILIELDSVASALLSISPDSSIKYEDNDPVSDQFIIRSTQSTFSRDTAGSVLKARTFQIVYYHEDLQEVLSIMDTFGYMVLDQRAVIPLQDDSLRFIRTTGYNYSHPVKTEANLYASVGVLMAEVREARTVETFEKIKEIYTSFGQ